MEVWGSLLKFSANRVDVISCASDSNNCAHIFKKTLCLHSKQWCNPRVYAGIRLIPTYLSVSIVYPLLNPP